MHKVIHQQQAQTDGEPKADQQHSVTFLHQLSRLSQPLFTQPSSIAYQQLLEEWRNVLRLEGDFQQSLR
ncbi:hypothetical protein PXX31_20115, partial [Vibrio cholerae]